MLLDDEVGTLDGAPDLGLQVGPLGHRVEAEHLPHLALEFGAAGLPLLGRVDPEQRVRRDPRDLGLEVLPQRSFVLRGGPARDGQGGQGQ